MVSSILPHNGIHWQGQARQCYWLECQCVWGCESWVNVWIPFWAGGSRWGLLWTVACIGILHIHDKSRGWFMGGKSPAILQLRNSNWSNFVREYQFQRKGDLQTRLLFLVFWRWISIKAWGICLAQAYLPLGCQYEQERFLWRSAQPL